MIITGRPVGRRGGAADRARQRGRPRGQVAGAGARAGPRDRRAAPGRDPLRQGDDGPQRRPDLRGAAAPGGRELRSRCSRAATRTRSAPVRSRRAARRSGRTTACEASDRLRARRRPRRVDAGSCIARSEPLMARELEVRTGRRRPGWSSAGRSLVASAASSRRASRLLPTLVLSRGAGLGGRYGIVDGPQAAAALAVDSIARLDASSVGLLGRWRSRPRACRPERLAVGRLRRIDERNRSWRS